MKQKEIIQLITDEHLLDEEAKIKIDYIPPQIISQAKITVGPTPPINPQTGEIWIQIE